MVTLRLPSLPFQFTPLREGRPGMFPYFSLSILFQFTPLREGRPPETFEVPYAARQFQFTPLREGRHESIGLASDLKISIHAPPRGATVAKHIVQKAHTYFNSRPSARGDGRTVVASAAMK